MKANGLMTGDYLSYHGQIIKVASITKKKVGYHIKDNECRMHYARLCECKPIPLTKEILEKNGFEKCNVDDDGAVQYEFGDDNLGIDLWVSMPCLLGAWRKWKGMEKSYNMINEFPIRYVHELQHALRLCGIEKEIEL